MVVNGNCIENAYALDHTYHIAVTRIFMRSNVERKTPEELVSRTQKHPLSTRVKVETYEALELIAKEVGTSLSDLSAGILDDYVHWYQSQPKGRTKRDSKK